MTSVAGKPQMNDLVARYQLIRRHLPEHSRIVLLHIGTDLLEIAAGQDDKPEVTRTLPLGYHLLAERFFQHTLPSPAEIELAIMEVEDSLAPWRDHLLGHALLVSRDGIVHEIAMNAGLENDKEILISLDTIEASFQRLSAVSLGRPAASLGIPASRDFAAALLILREFMHHLQFSSLILKQA